MPPLKTPVHKKKIKIKRKRHPAIHGVVTDLVTAIWLSIECTAKFLFGLGIFFLNTLNKNKHNIFI